MKSRNSGLRTVDVARRSGYSVQQVRNLEQDGVLPAATRTRSGYRVYTDRHTRAAVAYRELAAGVGPVEAKRIMRAAHAGPLSQLLALVDAAHAALDAERRELWSAKRALGEITAEKIEDPRPADSMSISELADALGVRPSTLRHWDAEGLVVPRRASVREARAYAPIEVRDARIIHQLRMAGYRIGALQRLMTQLRRARRWEDVHAALDARDASILSRSRALLRGSGALDSVIDDDGDGQDGLG